LRLLKDIYFNQSDSEEGTATKVDIIPKILMRTVDEEDSVKVH